jgi:hypothetical protein
MNSWTPYQQQQQQQEQQNQPYAAQPSYTSY